MKNTITINKRLLDMAMKYDNHIEPTEEEIKQLKKSMFEDNVTVDLHLLTEYIKETHNCDFDGINPQSYIMSCLSDFRNEFLKR